MGFLRFGKLEQFPSQATLCLGNDHSCPGTCPDGVRFELGHHCQDVEQEATDGIGGGVDAAANAQLDLPASEVIGDIFRVPQRSSEAVESCDDQGVAGPAGGQCFPESGTRPIGAGETLAGKGLPV